MPSACCCCQARPFHEPAGVAALAAYRQVGDLPVGVQEVRERMERGERFLDCAFPVAHDEVDWRCRREGRERPFESVTDAREQSHAPVAWEEDSYALPKGFRKDSGASGALLR